MRQQQLLKCGFLMLCALCVSGSAFAVKLNPEGYFNDWRVYSTQEGSGKVCFMVSAPQHTNVTRQDNYLAITHRPFEKSYDVVTLSLGAQFQKGSKPTIEIDNKKPIAMIPVEDTAFIKDASVEKDMIKNMEKGNVARTVAKSKKGTLLRDTYSLKGFSKAYNLLNKICSAKEK